MPEYVVWASFVVQAENAEEAEARVEGALDNMTSSGGEIQSYTINETTENF